MENVFKYRKNMEDKKKEELAEAIGKFNIEEEKLEKLILKKQSALEFFKSSLNITLMQQKEAYLKALDDSLEKQRKVIHEAKKVVNKKRSQLKIVSQDRKIMEDFKDKCLEKYRYELLREEQKTFDEVGVIGFSRRA